MSEEPRRQKIGKRSVVIGRVTGDVGEDCVVIGATDANGNTILREGVFGAHASGPPGSLVAGYSANSGSTADVAKVIAEIRELVKATQSEDVQAAHQKFVAAYECRAEEPQAASNALRGLIAAGAFNGAVELAKKAERLAVALGLF